MLAAHRNDIYNAVAAYKNVSPTRITHRQAERQTELKRLKFEHVRLRAKANVKNLLVALKVNIKTLRRDISMILRSLLARVGLLPTPNPLPSGLHRARITIAVPFDELH